MAEDQGKLIQDLSRKVGAMERKMLRAPRPHVTQKDTFSFARRGVSRLTTKDLKSGQPNLIEDDDGKTYIVFNVNGKIKKVEIS